MEWNAIEGNGMEWTNCKEESGIQKVIMEQNKELKSEVDETKEIDEIEEICGDAEELLGQIAVQQEMERWETQNKPYSETSEETKNSNFYKQSMTYAETIGEVLQVLLGYGIDYQNALSLANNLIVSDQNIQQAKVNNIQIQSQQI